MIPQYTELVRRRREAGVDQIRPGITGWAQINGRDTISTDEKFALDVDYLNRQSVVLICISSAAHLSTCSQRGGFGISAACQQE